MRTAILQLNLINVKYYNESDWENEPLQEKKSRYCDTIDDWSQSSCHESIKMNLHTIKR